MSEQDHLETIARRAVALQQQINDAGMGPPACPRCAALEAERDLAHRLLKELRDAIDADAELPVDASDRARMAHAVGVSHAMDAASALLSGIPVVGYEEMQTERDSARALLGELAAAARDYRRAVRIYNAQLSPHENAQGVNRASEALDEVLRRAEAEAGGGEG